MRRSSERIDTNSNQQDCIKSPSNNENSFPIDRIYNCTSLSANNKTRVSHLKNKSPEHRLASHYITHNIHEASMFLQRHQSEPIRGSFFWKLIFSATDVPPQQRKTQEKDSRSLFRSWELCRHSNCDGDRANSIINGQLFSRFQSLRCSLRESQFFRGA